MKAGYKRTEVGVIPEEWEVKTLGKCLIGRPSYGINAAAVPYSDNLPVYIRITDISEDGRFAPSKLVSVKSELSGNYYLSDGDIVFARTGASVGKSYRYDPDDGPLVFAGFLIRACPDVEKLLPDFLAAYIATGSYWQWVRLMSMRSGQPGINGNEYSQLPIPVPPLREQRAIAEALGDLDDLISTLEKLIAKKRNIKQAVMQQLLTGKTRLPGFNSIWNRKKLGELAEMDSGGTPRTSNAAYYGGEIPWASISDMTKAGKYITSTERYLTASGLSNSPAKIFQTGTILYAIYASVGECCISSIPMCTSQAILGIRPREMLDVDFLYYYLLTAKPKVKLMSQQGTQSNVGKNIVSNLEVPLPPAAEQLAIAEVLTDIDEELSLLEKRLTKTRDIKQAMMQELLTGKIRLV